MKDVQERTYYELLGLEPGATTEQIREAYREIARIFHPDSNFYSDIISDENGPNDSDVFKSITVAYNTLINEDKRRQYDQTILTELNDWDDNSGSSAFSKEDYGREAQPGPAKKKEQDIPEEWKREREHFEQHYEEILRPAPKVDLVGRDQENAFSGWENEVTGTRFGDLATEEELQAIHMTPQMRRIPRAKMRMDPFLALALIGIPIMLLVIILELIFFY